jgi:hypothetical protein
MLTKKQTNKYCLRAMCHILCLECYLLLFYIKERKKREPCVGTGLHKKSPKTGRRPGKFEGFVAYRRVAAGLPGRVGRRQDERHDARGGAGGGGGHPPGLLGDGEVEEQEEASQVAAMQPESDELTKYEAGNGGT